ncbi:MAG TPA: alkane 1-monooxygenase [Caulobacteraceae bacterium]|nr:alkane 1-monooxygenase [Caulobacteraceae bacterium]
MSQLKTFAHRLLTFAPFTLPLWLAASIPSISLKEPVRLALYFAGVFAIPVTLDFVGGKARQSAPIEHDDGRPYGEYALIPRLLALKFLLLQGLMVYFVVHRRMGATEVAILAAMIGLYFGQVGIIVSHELMHREGRFDHWLADLLLITVTYPHFSIEHVHGHHIRVATPEDPASARLNEPLYAFLIRSVGGSFAHAWAIEAERLGRQGKSWLSPQNRMIQYGALVVAYYAVALYVAGVLGLLAVAVQSAFAVLSLETVNYIQHYGLQRKKLANGRYEKTGVQHAWNWETRFSGWYFLNLGRHSEHHRFGTRRYELLAVEKGQPMLPGGVMSMYLTALIPPLWFAVMNPRVAAVKKAFETGAPISAVETPVARRRRWAGAGIDRWGGWAMLAAILVMFAGTKSHLGYQGGVAIGIALGIVALIVFLAVVYLPGGGRSPPAPTQAPAE